MGAIAHGHLAVNAAAHLAEKIHGVPGQAIPRGSKGVIGAPAHWNQTRVPMAGMVTGHGDTPVHPITLTAKK